MPWLKSGDNAATYPPLLSVLATEGADERLLNEVAGFVWRCASQSAGHLTDGIIDLGTASLMGGSRARFLLDVAQLVGLIDPVRVGGREAWRIVQDEEFLHIRDKEAVMWERQRDRDRKNPELTSAVRRRDGDACRYCGCVVNFLDRKGPRGGTYDHYEPGQPASIETYVIACRSHNSSMREGDRLPLLDPPTTPYYSTKTLEFLEAHGRKPAAGSYRTDPVHEDPQLTEGGHRRDTARPASARDTAPERRDPDTAGHAATRTTQEPAATPGHAPAKRSPRGSGSSASWVTDEGLATDLGGSTRSGVGAPGGARTGRVGTGGAGSGRDGPGRAGSDAEPPSGGRRRRRGRRGGGGDR